MRTIFYVSGLIALDVLSLSYPSPRCLLPTDKRQVDTTERITKLSREKFEKIVDKNGINRQVRTSCQMLIWAK